MASLQVLWTVAIFFMVTEPEIMSAKEARRQGKKSFFGKIQSILKLTYKACKEDHALAIGLFALSISRNGGMLQ